MLFSLWHRFFRPRSASRASLESALLPTGTAPLAGQERGRPIFIFQALEPVRAEAFIKHLIANPYTADSASRSAPITRGEARKVARWALRELEAVLSTYYKAREEAGYHTYPDPKLEKPKEEQWARAKRTLLGLADREPLLTSSELFELHRYLRGERWHPCHNMLRVLRCICLGQNQDLTEEGIEGLIGMDDIYPEVLERAFRHPAATPKVWRRAFGFGSLNNGRLQSWVFEQPGAAESPELVQALCECIRPVPTLLEKVAETPSAELWLKALEGLLRYGGLKTNAERISRVLDSATDEQARRLPPALHLKLLSAPSETVRLSAIRLIARGQTPATDSLRRIP